MNHQKEQPVRRLLTLGIATLVGLSALRGVEAQTPAAQDNILVAQAGVERLKDDLKFVLNLAPKGAAQWKDLDDFLANFVIGVDPKRPLRVDVILGTNRDYRLWVPYGTPADLKRFQDSNVKTSVGTHKAGGPKPMKKLMEGYYEWNGPGWSGFERDIKGWTILAGKSANVPATLTDPTPVLTPLLADGTDILGTITNTSAGQADRRKSLQDVRKDLTAKIKRLADEADYQFELRQLSHTQQMDEAERFYAESESLLLGWTLDTAKKEGRLDLKLKALAGTELEKTIKDLGAEPSAFAAPERTEKTTGYARVNHAIDAMRKGHLKAFLGLVKKQAVARIAQSKSIKPDHKASFGKAAEQFIDLLHAGVDLGVIDGFAQTEKAGDRQTMIGAIRVVDGTGMIPVLETLKGAEWDVQLNAETVGDLSLHVVKIPQRDDSDFSNLFDKNATLVVGTSKSVVWYAAGDDAVARLKAAVEKNATAEKTKDGVFLEAWANLGPWMNFLLERRVRVVLDEKGLTEDDKKMRKTKEGLLKLAVDVFKPGDGTAHIKLQSVDGEVTGRTTLSEGTLRFAGTKIAEVIEKMFK